LKVRPGFCGDATAVMKMLRYADFLSSGWFTPTKKYTYERERRGRERDTVFSTWHVSR
jgi:hypothetical protein